MKTVADDPDAPTLPVGCIGSDVLQSLARTVRTLEAHHAGMRGQHAHTPCLRHIESRSGSITASVYVGSGHNSRHELVYDPRAKVWFLEH